MSDEYKPYWNKWLKHWHGLVDPEGPEWTDEYTGSWMIPHLACDREKLWAVLEPLPCAKGLFDRICEIIDVAIPDPANPKVLMGMYFGVPNPYPATEEELIEWQTDYLKFIYDNTDEIEVFPTIGVERCDDPEDASEENSHAEAPDDYMALNDWTGDYMSRVQGVEGRAARYLLGESLYKMACMYTLAYFVEWVFIEDRLPGQDPYRTRFNMWRSNAYDCFVAPDRVVVYAPILTKGGNGST